MLEVAHASFDDLASCLTVSHILPSKLLDLAAHLIDAFHQEIAAEIFGT